MKFILSIIFSVFSLHSFSAFDHYPEERVYTQADRGLAPYIANSLYNTNTFSLTFDDGPHPVFTPLILDILKKHGVKATFFVLTSKINAETQWIIKRMLDEGHIVASHSFTHDRSVDQTETDWKNKFKRSFKDLVLAHKLAGHEMKKFYYRFPYGDYGRRRDYHTINALREASIELFGDNCVHMVFWDVDTADWLPKMTSSEVAQNIIAHNEGGSYVDFINRNGRIEKVVKNMDNPPKGGVVLQHDIYEHNVLATDKFLTYAASSGVNIVQLDTVDEFKITKDCKL